MPFAYDTDTATTSQTDFSISFPFLDRDDVFVYVDGTLKTVTTDYTFVSDTLIRFGTGLANGAYVVRQRKTNHSARLVDYEDPSSMAEEDLDNDSLQAFYMAQEAIDMANLALGRNFSAVFDATGLRVTEVADPTAAQDAATKEYVDEILVAEGNLPAATEAEDADILYVAAEGVATWGAVGELTIPDEAITGELIEDASINEEHFTAGGIVTAAIANEAITGALLEDLAVDTEHLAAESVTTAKIASTGVTTAKLSATGGTEGQVLSNEEAADVAWRYPGEYIAASGLVTWGTGEPETVDLIGSEVPGGVDEIVIHLRSIDSDAANTELVVQLAVAETFVTSGYTSSVSHGGALTTINDGLVITAGAELVANEEVFGKLTLEHVGSNEWDMSFVGHTDDGEQLIARGNISLGGTLTDVRVSAESATETAHEIGQGFSKSVWR